MQASPWPFGNLQRRSESRESPLLNFRTLSAGSGSTALLYLRFHQPWGPFIETHQGLYFWPGLWAIRLKWNGIFHYLTVLNIFSQMVSLLQPFDCLLADLGVNQFGIFKVCCWKQKEWQTFWLQNEICCFSCSANQIPAMTFNFRLVKALFNWSHRITFFRSSYICLQLHCALKNPDRDSIHTIHGLLIKVLMKTIFTCHFSLNLSCVWLLSLTLLSLYLFFCLCWDIRAFSRFVISSISKYTEEGNTHRHLLKLCLFTVVCIVWYHGKNIEFRCSMSVSLRRKTWK